MVAVIKMAYNGWYMASWGTHEHISLQKLNKECECSKLERYEASA